MDIDTSQIHFKPYLTLFETLILEHIIEPSIHRVFQLQFKMFLLLFSNKLIEYNENLEHPLYRPSHLESLREKSYYFEVQDIETIIKRQNNPHYWVQQDI